MLFPLLRLRQQRRRRRSLFLPLLLLRRTPSLPLSLRLLLQLSRRLSHGSAGGGVGRDGERKKEEKNDFFLLRCFSDLDTSSPPTSRHLPLFSFYLSGDGKLIVKKTATHFPRKLEAETQKNALSPLRFFFLSERAGRESGQRRYWAVVLFSKVSHFFFLPRRAPPTPGAQSSRRLDSLIGAVFVPFPGRVQAKNSLTAPKCENERQSSGFVERGPKGVREILATNT